MHYIVLCQYMSTKMLERGRMEQKLEFYVWPEKKNWQGSALYMFSSYIYTKSLWSTDFQKALSGIHCMMIVTPNDEHLRSVRPLRQALSMIVHFTYQRTGSLALWCHIPPCFVYNHWLLTFGGGCFWLCEISSKRGKKLFCAIFSQNLGVGGTRVYLQIMLASLFLDVILGLGNRSRHFFVNK